MLSPGVVAMLIYLVKVAVLFLIVYKIISGGPIKPRSIAASVVAAIGLYVCYEGFDIARMEENRARYGSVAPGVVLQKLGSVEPPAPRSTGPRVRRRFSLRPVLAPDGFRPQQRLARWIATGSPTAWIIVYRYPCAAYFCDARDFVSEATWSRLQVGQAVDVRTIVGEPHTERLEDNPRWSLALIEAAIGVVLVFCAHLISGRPLFRPRDWITAPAVVLRVEPVTYPDGGVRQRIHFAYFDPQGQAQESADEVSTGAWKAGDDCIAVFQPKTPDLATLRPLET